MSGESLLIVDADSLEFWTSGLQFTRDVEAAHSARDEESMVLLAQEIASRTSRRIRLVAGWTSGARIVWPALPKVERKKGLYLVGK